MIELGMQLRASAGKSTEILQTVESVVLAVRQQGGCLLCTFHANPDGRTIHIVQEWVDQAALNAYLRSREHRALFGAIATLCRHYTLLKRKR